MGIEQTGLGQSGGKTPTGIILVGLLLLAVVLAVAANSGKTIPVGPQPTPSASISAS